MYYKQVNKKQNYFSRMIRYIRLNLFPYPSSLETIGYNQDPIVLITNNFGIVSKISNIKNKYYYVPLDSGGTDILAAGAFNLIKKNYAMKRLSQETPLHQNEIIFIPEPLSRRWKLKNEDIFVGRKVSIFSDFTPNFEPLVSDEVMKKSIFLILRLKYAFLYWIGQVLIFIFPLSIYGWKVALVGLGLSFLSTLFLAFLWDYLPNSTIFKGIFSSVLCSLVVYSLALLLFSCQTEDALLLGLVSGIFNFWMSIVFQGLRRT